MHPEEEEELSDVGPGSRRDFLVKVYSIVSAQLLITAGIATALYYDVRVREFFRNYYWILFVFIGLYFGILIPLAISKKLRTSFHWNLILLIGLTVAFGLCIGLLLTILNWIVLLLAIVCVAVISFIMAVFSRYSPCKLCGKPQGVVLAVGISLVVSAIAVLVTSYFYKMAIFQFIALAISVVINSVYLYCVTELIFVGYFAKFDIDAESIIGAVLALYTLKVTIVLQLAGLIQTAYNLIIINT